MNDRNGNPIVIGDLYVVVGEALSEFTTDRVALDTARPLVVDNTSAGNPPTLSHVSTDLVPLDSIQAADALLTAIAALTTAADRLAYFTGVDTVALTTFTAAARTFCAAADAAAQRTALGLTPAGGLEQTGSNVQIADNGVTNAKLRDSAGVSVIGRAANSTGDPADITAASDGLVLRRTSSVVAFGTVDTAGITANAVTNTVLRDSAALSVIGRSANSTGDPADIAAGSDGHVLRRSGTTLGFGTIATAGIAANAVTGTILRDSAALSVIGNGTNATADPADITAGTDGHVLRRSGTTLGFGTLAPTASLAGITTDRLLGRDTAATGAAEEITVGGNLEFTGSGGIQRGALTGAVTASAGSGTTAFGSFKANSILMNMTNASGVPTAVDGTDAAANMWAFLGGSYLLPAWNLADAKLGSIAI